MSEEEIIKICNKLIADFKNFQEMREKDKNLNIYQWNSYDDIFKEYKQAIQGLLDLYQKEKQKNKELEYKLREHICIEAHEQVKQLYIPKSKVKEKIEELEKLQEENRKQLDKGIQTISFKIINETSNKININIAIKDILQELLQEGNK